MIADKHANKIPGRLTAGQLPGRKRTRLGRSYPWSLCDNRFLSVSCSSAVPLLAPGKGHATTRLHGLTPLRKGEKEKEKTNPTRQQTFFLRYYEQTGSHRSSHCLASQPCRTTVVRPANWVQIEEGGDAEEDAAESEGVSVEEEVPDEHLPQVQPRQLQLLTSPTRQKIPMAQKSQAKELIETKRGGEMVVVTGTVEAEVMENDLEAMVQTGTMLFKTAIYLEPGGYLAAI